MYREEKTRMFQHFNPRSPWGERRFFIARKEAAGVFQSTLPVGGATVLSEVIHADHMISIHAPRGGSDSNQARFFLAHVYFNPRSPWGERLGGSLLLSFHSLFQSTLPVGGATRKTTFPRTTKAISIHAPRGGSDNIGDRVAVWIGDFNPRSPWGERRRGSFKINTPKTFQSTLPVGGATAPR